jgi:conjugal transfer pilus assembly protein TraF
MKPIYWIILTLLCSGYSSLLFAAQGDSYWKQHERGWFWYEDPAPAEEAKETENKPAQEQAATPTDPLEQLKRIQDEIARAEARAVLNPTPENMRDYLTLNQWQLQQSSLFADMWRRTVWENPELDYSLKRPTNSQGIQQFHDIRKQDKASAVAQVSSTHGLFFFFKGTCPYCHKFAPILQSFSEMYGINVLPISIDGGNLPEYPNPKVDMKVAAQLGVETVPSVYLVDPKRRNVIPVGNGVMSVDELANRIYVLTQLKPGDDF